jgi:hypothetical protein
MPIVRSKEIHTNQNGTDTAYYAANNRRHQKEDNMNEIIIALASGLLGSFIGGLIAIYGGIMVVRRTEYYRLRSRTKKILGYTISKVGQHNRPWVLVRDDATDDMIRDILLVMPCLTRIRFKKKWKEYRYDKKMQETVPDVSADLKFPPFAGEENPPRVVSTGKWMEK